MAKLIIGLTGGIGSGKSAASACFEALGITVVDADIVAREVVEPGRPALASIENHFGSDILLDDGNLNRARLREIIFTSPEEKAWLEQLLHPLIREEIIQQLNPAQSDYAILVSPLLFETDQHSLCTRTLLIDLPVEMQIDRASQRDNNDEDQIKRIIASQMSRECKLEKADDIILNDQDLDHLKQAVSKKHQYYLELIRE